MFPRRAPPLAALWLPRQASEFEEARWHVLAIMIAELREQPGPDELLARLLDAQPATAETSRQPEGEPAGNSVAAISAPGPARAPGRAESNGRALA